MEVDLGAQSGLHAHFWDHAVSGRALFPAAGFLELACGTARALASSGQSAASLAGLSIPSPCLLSAPGAHVTVLRAEVSTSPEGLGRFHISGGRVAHVAGSVASVASGAAADDGSATSRLASIPAPSCVGSIEILSSSWWESGCWSSPAALDGAMQLGGASVAATEIGRAHV